MIFIFKIPYHFSNVFDMVMEGVNIFHFFSIRCSTSLLSNRGLGYNLSFFCPIQIVQVTNLPRYCPLPVS